MAGYARHLSVESERRNDKHGWLRSAFLPLFLFALMLACARGLPFAAQMAHQPIHWYQELMPWLGLLSLILYLAPREAWGWPRRVCFQTAELVACAARITTRSAISAMDRLARRSARELRGSHFDAMQMRGVALQTCALVHVGSRTSMARHRAAASALRSHIRVEHVGLAAREVPVPAEPAR